MLGWSMPPDALGDILKILQITFFGTGTIIAILTYRAAKRGLLNTVNSEFQKRVMDRTAQALGRPVQRVRSVVTYTLGHSSAGA
jgi:hypothetical protein